jgi:hypothetical protein
MMATPQSPTDSTAVFEQLWEITNELRQKLDDRFPTQPDPVSQPLKSYTSTDQTAFGSLNTFSSSEIDWLVHSWIRNPQMGFCNMHFTVWLGSQIRVPHLAIVFATVPDLFFYMDYVPRSDLYVDLASLDRYYTEANDTFLALQSDERLKPYTSKALYIRQAQSLTNLCYTCQVSQDTLTLSRHLAHEMMDRWLSWVDAAEAVPTSEQPSLAERDLLIRRTVAERDPDNAIAVKLFGADLTNQLIRGLWGGDRT